MSNSPLTEVDPASIDELFSRDPLSLSTQEIATIVAVLRAQADNWKQAEESGKKSAPKVKSVSIPALDNLELDL